MNVRGKNKLILRWSKHLKLLPRNWQHIPKLVYEIYNSCRMVFCSFIQNC